HVNRRTLPQNIIDGLNSGNGVVTAGERIGQVVPWPTMFHYVHVHLNVFDSAGNAINPESVFEVIPDSIAPDVSFLAVYQDDSTEWLKEGSKLSKPVKSFIVSGADAKDLHQYVQAVPFIELTQNGVVLSQIDFRHTLLDAAGVFTDIRGFYPNTVRLSDKTLLRQPADFYPVAGTKFHQLLNVTGVVVGQPFQLKVQDMAGNATVLSGQF
ncbi:MAG: hypothetical protein AABZ31_14245, partial [Bdellovibrionota bacterium]